MTNKPPFGSVEYYSKLFQDIICDAQPDCPQYGDNIVQGFLLAIAEWRQYHIDQVKELERVNRQLQAGEADAAAAAFLLQQETLRKGLSTTEHG